MKQTLRLGATRSDQGPASSRQNLVLLEVR